MNEKINLYIIENSQYSHYDFDRDKLINICKEYAEQIASEYDLNFILNFLREKDFKIEEVSNNSKYITYRAQVEITNKVKRILIYKDIIEEDYHNLVKCGYDISFNDIKNIYLVHEFFHVLEYYNMANIIDKVDKVEYKTLFNKKKLRSNKVSSEICANYFSQSVLDLKFNPYFLELIEEHKTLEGVLNEIQL